jgi:hypothetical protein
MRASLIIVTALVGALVGGATRPTAPPDRAASSARPLRTSVEAALERGDFVAAFRATEAAHRRAIRERRWDSLIEVGDTYHRIAGRPGAPEAASYKARDAYRAALRSARREESLDGVLRAAEAFAQIGDGADVEMSLHIARDLAGSDPEAVDDVKAAEGRLSDLLESTRPGDRGVE